MSAQVQCMRCGLGFNTADQYIAHLDGRCVCFDELEITDEEIAAFLARSSHPSLGGDAA